MNEDTIRSQLSDALRITSSLGLDEGICNHFSATVSPGIHLINPADVHWSQMTPDALVLIDDTGAITDPRQAVETTAAQIHSAWHANNPRHKAVLHTHMPHATALSMLSGGRLEPAHQNALRFWGRTAAHDSYNGLVLDHIEATALSRPNSPDIVFLANHGVVVAGPNIAEALDDLYYLERAAHTQILAMSTGQPLKLIPDDVCERTASQFAKVRPQSALAHFEARRSMLSRLEPSIEHTSGTTRLSFENTTSPPG